MYNPMSLNEAMEKAKQQESLMEFLEKHVCPPVKTFQASNTPREAQKPGVHTNKWPEIKHISSHEMARQREKGLC